MWIGVGDHDNGTMLTPSYIILFQALEEGNLAWLESYDLAQAIWVLDTLFVVVFQFFIKVEDNSFIILMSVKFCPSQLSNMNMGG